MKKLFILLLFILPVLVLARNVLVFPNADIYYPEGYEDLAVYIGNTFESIRHEAIDLIGNDPGRINIVLLDKGTDTNGIAFSFNHKTIHIYLWPSDAALSTRMNVSNPYRQLLIHEFTHIIHLTYTTGLPAFISRVLLGTELLSPQNLSPFIEGVTVFAESTNYLSEGRLNNPLWGKELAYQNYTAGVFPELAYVLAVSREDYRGGALYYNYMAAFYDYLVRRFGIDAVKNFHREISGRLLPVIGTITSAKNAFGATLDDLYNDWEKEVALRSTTYATLTEIKIIENGQIIDMAGTGDGVVFSYVRNGEASAWVGAYDRGLGEINDDGFDTRLSDFGATSLKWKDGSTYLMTSVAERGRVSREIWQQRSAVNVRLLDKGEISAFDVFNGKLVTAVYNKKEGISTIYFDKMEVLRLPWLVRDMIIMEDGSYVMLLSRNGINGAIGFFGDGEFKIILDDPYMKGRGIDVRNGLVVYTAAYEAEYMDAFAVDLSTGEIYRLTEGANLEKAVLSEDYIYGFGQSRLAKGMSIYRFDYSIVPYEVKEVESDSFDPAESEYEMGDYLKKAFLHFVNPVLRTPLVEYDGKDFSLGFLFLNMSLDGEHSLTVNPSFNFGTLKPSLTVQYNGRIIGGIDLALDLNLGKTDLPLGSAAISTELFQMPINPSTRFRSSVTLQIDTSGDLSMKVPLSLGGNIFKLTLNPGFKLTAGKIGLILSLDALFVPTLETLVEIGMGFDEELYWYAGGAQVLFRIDRGWSPLLFFKEVGLGAKVLGKNLIFDGALAYLFMNIGTTIGLGDLYPKIGLSYFDGKFGFYFSIDGTP